MKNDIAKSLTIEQLKRQYKLDTKEMLKAIELEKTQLNKLEVELNNYIEAVTKDIKDLQDQVDGNITTWFFVGIPTLENRPANEWITDKEKANHLGDLYYDTDTGKAYRFAKQIDSYLWLVITDSDVTEALALAHKAQDTADGKRRVFTTTPIVPYDIGDLWLNNEELYVCETARATGSFTLSDFKIATKYTDDTALRTFVDGEYADEIAQINNQIDKKAETWYQSTDPSSNWTTIESKEEHVGDLWYKTDENKNYIYISTFAWQEIDGVPDSVYDQIDGKAQIFTSQPITPYYVGDLYAQGSTGDILVCIAERLVGGFVSTDWQKAGKYTDDTNLNNFVNVTFAEAMTNMTNQIDSKITTWYFNGTPTLENQPANEWTTVEEKTKHTGDLYYDKATGKSYIFQLDGATFSWSLIEDNKISEALALANSAKDTADSKRRVFVNQPIPPYDNGDLWINNNEVYICQISKESGTFSANDFINNLKYTDDTLANEVDGKLTVVSGKVAIIETSVSEISQQVEENKYYVDSDGNQQLISSSMTQVTQDLEGLEIETSNFDTNLLENYYTKENIDNLIMNAETGLTNLFTQSGGFNLLRETAPYTINSNGTIPYWEGNIGRIKDEDYSSGYALLLQNGIVKQTVVLKNNIYSLGFKYKKLIPNSLCIAKYNGREIALTEDDGEISTTGEITTGSITIEFDCDTENGFSIGELMLNIGEVLSSWSQNQNESHSDTVNISDGITVSSSSSNTDAKMDADGFRVVAKGSGENTLKATDDGVETPEIKAGRGDIANLIIQKIGDEIWITGGDS